MERRLIKKVCDHDLLYTVDHVHYRDRQMRALAWAEISKELGMPAQQCKETWRKLRNCYLNAINRRQTKNIPKWKYETEMAFLLPYLDIRPPQTDEKHVSASYIDCASEIADYDATFENMSTRGDSPEVILPETSGMLVPSHNNKRGYSDDSADTMQDQQSPSARKGGRRFDETEMFFLSMSQTVKRLRPVDQAKVKMQLCNMVYEAEIRLLEEDEMEENA